ncbi:MAG: hypothetical protein JWO58_388 [Chitinophagaceae bacterium]|nr:hypothetical protein [Chitinophagaceae bacterium]
MKKTIIYSVTALAFCLISLVAKAQRGQENNTPESKSHKVADHLKEKLALSDEQTTKVYDLNITTIKDTRSLKVAKRNDVSGLKEGFSEIHGQYDQAMKKILTADQYSKWKIVQSEARAREQKERQDQSGKSKFNANEEDPEEEMTWEEAD